MVSVKWLELSGNKYLCQKSVTVINVNEGVPVFGPMKDMYTGDSSLYCFECQVYNTVCFSREFASYEIEVPNLAQATEIVDADQIVDYTSYYALSFKNRTYIPLKYYLRDVCEIYKSSTEC